MNLLHSDRMAIVAAVQSYRKGAPMTLEDVRIACAMDGHPINHVNRSVLASFMRTFCTVEHGPHGPHDERTYRWLS